MHYLGGMRTWAPGLNYYLLHNRRNISYEPFACLKKGMNGWEVTSDLSGLDFTTFKDLLKRAISRSSISI